MLKRKFYRKILVTTSVLFSFFLMNFLPDGNNDITQKLEYINNYDSQTIYLIDQYNMVARTNVYMDKESDVIKQAKKMLELLILGGESESKLPSGFRGIVPNETKIIGISFKDSILKINFSKELLDVEEKLEEKVIEAIIFSMTEIEGVEKIIIYIEDEILTKLPKSKINLPTILDRSFGINKKYSIQTYKNIEPVIIYYISKYNNDYYYVPVTKYVNDSREKIKIIIEELSSSPLIETNLMSFLNSNTKLLATQEEVNSLFLVFNEYIFSDMDSRKILEEVIYSISLSVGDNYEVKEVIFKTEEDEICKSVIKTLE